MKIIEPIYIPSKEVTSWLSIKDEAEELACFVDDIRNSVFAIHHMQVSEKPLNFFVLKPAVLGQIVEEVPDWGSVREGSASHRCYPKDRGGDG